MPSKKGVQVPPQLLGIVRQASGKESENISQAIKTIETKANKSLNSYVHCVCMRVNLKPPCDI
jgi:hypothetical protein